MAESSASEKALMRAAQVCQALDIQPYQLKFWETEFLELGRRVGPKRLYGPAEVEIASEIKSLLVDARLNLSEARSVLGERFPLDVPERDIEPVDGGAGTAEGSDSHVTSGPAPQDSRLAQAEDELRQLRSRVVILERALADARAEARALADEQRSELAAERTIVASLREALENARRDVKQATESLAKEQTKSRTLKSDLSNATERVAELETRLEALALDAVSVRRLEEDIAALEERLATSERSRLEAEDAASIRQEELLAIRRLREDDSGEREALVLRLAAAEAEAAQAGELVARAAELESEAESARTAADRAEREAVALRSRVVRLTSDLDQTRAAARSALREAESEFRSLLRLADEALMALAGEGSGGAGPKTRAELKGPGLSDSLSSSRPGAGDL